MSGFEDLVLPAVENISVGFTNKWFVTIRDLTNVNKGILMVDGSGIGQASIGGDHSMFYFDSELQAFSVSALYYANHNMAYPYWDEWDEAKKREFNNSVPAGAGTFSESKAMDFI